MPLDPPKAMPWPPLALPPACLPACIPQSPPRLLLQRTSPVRTPARPLRLAAMSRRQVIITSNFKGARPALVLAQAASLDLSPDSIAEGIACGELRPTHIPFESVRGLPEGVKTYAFDMAATGVQGRGRCDMAYGGYFHRPTESMLLEMDDGSKLQGWAGLGWAGQRGSRIGTLQQRAGHAMRSHASCPPSPPCRL